MLVSLLRYFNDNRKMMALYFNDCFVHNLPIEIRKHYLRLSGKFDETLTPVISVILGLLMINHTFLSVPGCEDSKYITFIF